MDTLPAPISLAGILESFNRIQANVVRRFDALRALRVGALPAGALGRLGVASHADVEDLHTRLRGLERRIHKLAAKRGAGTRRAAAG